MYAITLKWKGFNVNLKAVEDSIRASYDDFAGTQAHSVLELWFNSEPSSGDKAAIQAYWDGIDSDSDEATSYESSSVVLAAAQAAQDALIASANAKLLALGLSAEEIAALRG